MKVYLSPSDQHENAYATGGTVEATQCRLIANATERFLKEAGVAVINNTAASMEARVAESNAWGADLHVCIHTNAYNRAVGGSRVFYYADGTSGYAAAKCVYAELAPVSPGTSDSMGPNPELYEIKNTYAPCVYCECEFHDVPALSDWIIGHTTDLGRAIASGILKYFDMHIPSSSSSAPASDPSSSSSAEPVDTASTEGGTCNVELKVLTPGMEDPQVHAFMLLMKAKGYYPYEISENDNLYGPRMRAGLHQMQVDHDLIPDDIAGALSWNFVLN